jgi:PilZ domain
MTDGSEKQRRHPRFQVDVQATARTADGRKLPARTRDLSRSGICLVTTEALSPSTRLSVELVLLLGPSSSSEPLPLQARVVWCTAIAGAFQVGAMFDGISGREAAFLDMFLRYLDGTILPAGAEMDIVDDSDDLSPSEDVAVIDLDDDPFEK